MIRVTSAVQHYIVRDTDPVLGAILLHHQRRAKLHYTSCLDGVWIKIKKFGSIQTILMTVWIDPN